MQIAKARGARVVATASPANHEFLSDLGATPVAYGDGLEQLAFIRRENLDEFPYLLSAEVGMAYQIGKLPYGVLIDAQGKVAAHGLINTREHLESLFEAKQLGFSSVQQFHAAHS